MEKLQFVQDFKIEELRGELEPRDEQLAACEDKIKVRGATASHR